MHEAVDDDGTGELVPASTTRKDADKTVRLGLQPDGTGGLGSQGVDLYTRQGQLPDFACRRLENCRVQDGALSRRLGSKRLHAFTNNTGAYTFAATTKYATFTPPLIPAGGWADLIHFTAVRPSAGNTGWVIGSRPSGQAFHVRKVTIDENGAVTSAWTDSGGTARTVTTSAITANAVVHLLSIYDPVAGTYTVFVDGTSSGTPLTGLASTLKPDQTTGVVWTFAVEKQTGSAVTANSNFDGAVDAYTLFTLRGVQAAQGSPSLVGTLKAHTFRQWPNPAMPMVLAHYPLDETTGSVMYDYSKHRNAGTYVGTPTAGAAKAISFPVGNFCGVFQKANGARVNLCGVGGAAFYETVRSGS